MFEKSGGVDEVVAHDVRWTPVDALVWLVLSVLAVALAAGVYTSVRYDGVFPDQLSAVDLLVLQPVLWAAYLFGPWFVSKTKGQGFVADYGTTMKPIDIPVGIVAGVLTQLVLVRGLYWLISLFYDGDVGAEARKLAEPMSGPIDWSILIFAVVVMAPIVEEFFFRGLLLRSVQRVAGVKVAVVVSAVVFGLAHQQGLQLPGLILVGVISAILVIRSGRLGLGIWYHVGFNAAGMATLYYELH